MTARKENLSAIPFHMNHLPVSSYGNVKITTQWMLRDKVEARSEDEKPAPRHRRNPFARIA